MASFVFVCAIVLFSVFIVFYCQSAGLGNPYAVNDDARQYLFPFFSWSDPSLFQADLIANYASSVTPLGVKAVYWGFLPWLDVVSISKVLPFLLCPLTAVFLFLTGRRIWSATAGTFTAVCLVLYAWHITCFSGGFPRAFGFPLCALFMYLCASRRWFYAGVVCLSQAFFYPPLALVCGSVVIIWRVAEEKECVNWVKVWMVLVVMMLGLVAVVLTSRVYGSPWFGKMYTWTEMRHMPEFFLDGRTPIFVDNWHRLTTDLTIQERVWGIDAASPLSGLMAVLSVIGVYLFYRGVLKMPAFIMAGFMAAVAWYFLAWFLLLDLFLPGRILKFVLPVMLALVSGAVWSWMAQQFNRLGAVFFHLATAYLLFSFSWPLLLPQVYDYSENKDLYAFLSTLPKDAVIAGHPREMDGVPLFSKRRAYVIEELSLPFNRSYYKEIQRRTVAVFLIYYATNKVQLKEACAREHIRFIVIRSADFEKAYLNRGVFYLEPYNAIIKNLIAREHGQGFVLESVRDKAVVFKSKDVRVIDVSMM